MLAQKLHKFPSLEASSTHVLNRQTSTTHVYFYGPGSAFDMFNLLLDFIQNTRSIAMENVQENRVLSLTTSSCKQRISFPDN